MDDVANARESPSQDVAGSREDGVDRNGGLAADDPNDNRQDDGDDHAGSDRKVENAVLCFDANVSRQASETEAGEPWPQQPNQQKNRPDGDQNPLHIRHRTACRAAKERMRFHSNAPKPAWHPIFLAELRTSEKRQSVHLSARLCDKNPGIPPPKHCALRLFDQAHAQRQRK
jgi:hypothetical protein